MNIKATTVIGIVKDGKAAMAADGQVTIGDTIMKMSARKLRKLCGGTVLVGFSGAGADAFTLMERLEEKLEAFRGNLPRACVELAREWRSDKYLRELNAMLAAVDSRHALIIGGSGEVVESPDGIVSVGSGSPYAISAARALMKHTRMGPLRIAREAITIASEICIYTGGELQSEEICKQQKT